MHIRRTRRAQSKKKNDDFHLHLSNYMNAFSATVPIFRYEQIAVHFTNHHACHVSWTATKNCRMLHLPSNNAFAGHDMSI